MYGKKGDTWFTIIFCGCFLLIGVVFTGIAICFLFGDDASAGAITAGFGFMGVLFVGIGAAFLLGRNRKKRIAEKVRTEGRRLDAVVTSVNVNTSYSMNGRNLFVANCQVTDGTTIHTFRSQNIWFDPSPAIWTGMDISVYVNRDNYDEYWVDTDTPLASTEVISH